MISRISPLTEEWYCWTARYWTCFGQCGGVLVDDFLDVVERDIAILGVIADLFGSLVASRPLSPTTTTGTVDSSVMGRTPTKSIAKVYADVNAKLGPSWHEYGAAQPLWLTRHSGL